VAGLPKDPVHAVALFQMACDMGNAAGCSSFGVMYTRAPGFLKSRLAPLSCNSSPATLATRPAANNLGSSYAHGDGGLPKDPVRALALYQKACDGRIAAACVQLRYARQR
jgi:TPR repeat protein